MNSFVDLQQKQYSIIATQDRKNQSGGGIVNILFYFDEQNEIQALDPDIFPSGKCWIINDYENAIESKYQPGEMFRINGISRSRNSADESTSSDGLVEWCCTSTTKVSSIRNELIQVIDCLLPDINTGELTWSGDDLQRGVYFINDKKTNEVHGPFEITIQINGNNRQYIASPYTTPSIRIPNHHITVVDFNKIRKADIMRDAEVNGEIRTYVSSLKLYASTMSEIWNVIDYISAPQLMKFISEIKISNNKKLISNSKLGEVKRGLEEFLKKKKNNLSSSTRYERAIDLLSSDDSYHATWIDILDEYIQTNQGREALKKHSINKQVQSSDLLIKQKNSELKQIESALDTKEKELSDIDKEILEQKDKLSKTKEEVENKLLSKNKALQEAQQSLESKIKKLQDECSIIEKKYDRFVTLDQVNQELKDLSRDKERLEIAIRHCKRTLGDPESMIEKITEVHAVMDTLGYSQRTSTQEKSIQEYRPESSICEFKPTHKNTLNFIHTITQSVNDMDGRELSEAEVANLLICMQQNLMMILQGRPGVGKTSTAINLANALGIHKRGNGLNNSDFLNIPVARGWSSSRDLIGFYNGLRDIFQPARTGLYEFLINGEKEEAKNPRIVLLDEANLSPIEHYWSDFIGLTDKEGMDRAIDTGISGDKRFIHPARNNTLRFIATVNNDSTTEPLSPRLLSRAPVICMDNIDISTEDTLGGELTELDGVLSANMMERIFGRSADNDDRCNGDDLAECLHNIINIGIKNAPALRESLQINGRKQQAITSYLRVAGSIMVDNKALAQDFAMSQFVLPHLNGEGEKVRYAILEMIEQARSNCLDRSAKIMEKILEDGDSYLQSYSFL
ncbi:AAA family ATPase [Dongshaea marina]|uniref:AAA family ATPase n=1 Tax=Dongshaea marina TaxID=2047966 RepID=UPI000D3EB51D|nr:AAA family ATPase [Dongshaea marina]